MKRIFTALLFILGFYPSLALSAEAPERYETRLSAGIVRLNQNDLGDALESFKEALKEHPQGVEALYYLGVTEARAGQVNEAEQSFKEALSLDRTFLPAHFDLGVLYYQAGRDKEALDAFETVKKIDPDRARVYYYEGLILRRSGRPKEAAAALKKASSLDPDLAPEANYYLGAAYYQMGETDAAREALENVVALSPESEIGQSAGTLLKQMAPAGGKKRWDLSFSAGLQYDDNVILEPRGGGPPLPSGITDKKDLSELVYLRGRYQFLKTPQWSGRAEYDFYQNFHRDAALSDFNLQNHHFTLGAGRRIGRGELSLQYELQYALLGGDPYLFRQSVGPRFLFPESEKHLTEFSYQFGGKRFYNNPPLFPNNSDRDVQTHQFGATHYVAFGSKGSLRAGYIFENERAGASPNEDDWTFKGHHFLAGVVLPPWNQLTLGIDMEYILRRFDHDNQQAPGVERSDGESISIVTLSRSFGRRFDLSAQYVHQQNHSNISLFEYNRNIYGLVATVKF